tara:strand:+ start:432 stop:605 length:174 start_codon:yes stop_codon:yes gene_type:complete
MTSTQLNKRILKAQKQLKKRILKAGEESELHNTIDTLRGIRNGLERLENQLMHFDKK